jgi:hypothetical protein
MTVRKEVGLIQLKELVHELLMSKVFTLTFIGLLFLGCQTDLVMFPQSQVSVSDLHM